MKRIVLGITAHVDAGKTTLSEGMLYVSGAIRKIGRVDNGDAFLDTNGMEKARGITIFSKQAMFSYEDMEVTLLDTPGHVDFSAEMERTLQVLDYAILVISGADGVQGHTMTLWRLLKRYGVPVFLFVNKMDQQGIDAESVLQELREKLSSGCVDFTEEETESFYEMIAMEEENAMEEFLESGAIRKESIQQLIQKRIIFPCMFGSALKLEGVEEFLQLICKYGIERQWQEAFGAKVFKIARDEQDNRLSYIKITGGSLKVKTPIEEEKVNQIRIYSGNKYETVQEVMAGQICAVTGLEKTFPGQGIGSEQGSNLPVLEPVMTYQIVLPSGMDAAVMLPKLRQLEEEEPELHISWNEKLQEIHAQIMGEVQIEILHQLIKERYGVEVEFGAGNIVYKETIADIVEGVGHFEPLRHYAEVHLLLEPGEEGSGMQFAIDCSEDVLDKNWQRLIYTHLEEKEHLGVLTGSVITDMKITLINGRAHLKHTEGGDFRQATYRAIRQGLKQAQSILLEPYYEFRLEVPQAMVGRAMNDMEKLHGTFEGPFGEGDMSVLTGYAPVACMREYPREVIAYSKGQGSISLSLYGYKPCHNEEEVIKTIGYDSERDLDNPTGSVFCAHGAGFAVSWDEVPHYMHLEGRLLGKQKESLEHELANEMRMKAAGEEIYLGVEEIDAILNRASNANAHGKEATKKWKSAKKITAPVMDHYVPKSSPTKEDYLLVDGYNIIFAWDELKELAADNIDGARGRLLDILCNYQGMKKCNLIVVFDAYRVQGHRTELLDYHNIHVVYTKEAETADAYIEKFAHDNSKKYNITVATSDGLEQIIIRGQGCMLLSARDLYSEIQDASKQLEEKMEVLTERNRNYVLDSASEKVLTQLRDLTKEEEFPKQN